jgi:polyisoprenoid-binding protein YceI
VRRAIKWLIRALVVAILVIVGFVVWYVFGSRVPGKPELSVTASTGGGPRTPDGSWHVLPGKGVYVGYRIKELFGDAVLKRDAVGRTLGVNGTLTIRDHRVTAAKVSADLDRLGSDRDARDAYVRDNTLETATYPTARFTLTKPIVLPAQLTKAKVVRGLEATGRLLLHGVTRPITFTLDARWNGPTIDAVGTAPIVLADYRIEPPHTVIANVDGRGAIELDLTFAPNG